jgi:hypothetical protein
MLKLSPELEKDFRIAPKVKRTAFIHPILGEINLATAPAKLGAKLLKYGYLIEKPVKSEEAEKPTRKRKNS